MNERGMHTPVDYPHFARRSSDRVAANRYNSSQATKVNDQVAFCVCPRMSVRRVILIEDCRQNCKLKFPHTLRATVGWVAHGVAYGVAHAPPLSRASFELSRLIRGSQARHSDMRQNQGTRTRHLDNVTQ